MNVAKGLKAKDEGIEGMFATAHEKRSNLKRSSFGFQPFTL